MQRANYLVTVEADSSARINIDEHDQADLYGDVVLGVVSAHSKLQAMQFMLHHIPKEARQDIGWIDCPSQFGMAAFKLHADDRKEG